MRKKIKAYTFGDTVAKNIAFMKLQKPSLNGVL